MGFLQFTEIVDANQEKKTKTWAIQNYARVFLGHVKWHSPWRKYVWYPAEDTIFDPECLEDIAERLRSETDKQKETWK